MLESVDRPDRRVRTDSGPDLELFFGGFLLLPMNKGCNLILGLRISVESS